MTPTHCRTTSTSSGRCRMSRPRCSCWRCWCSSRRRAAWRSPVDPAEDAKGRTWAWRFLLPGFVLALLAFNVTRHYAVRDEVAVNLEHTFNLFHFGRFSMSPTAPVDGTVEYVFYLLHLPFAASARLLAVGNWLICTLVAVLTLWLLGRGRLIGDARRNALFLLFPAAFSPLFLPMGTGFGNGLLSAAFVLQLIFVFRGRWAAAIAVAALLPLLRPDGTLWAMVLPTAILADRFAMRLPVRPQRAAAARPGADRLALCRATLLVRGVQRGRLCRLRTLSVDTGRLQAGVSTVAADRLWTDRQELPARADHRPGTGRHPVDRRPRFPDRPILAIGSNPISSGEE